MAKYVQGIPPPRPTPSVTNRGRGGSPTGGQWLASSEDGGARSWHLLVMKMWRGGQNGVLMNTKPPGPILRPGTRGPHSVHGHGPDVSPGSKSGQSIAGPGLCPKSRRHLLPPAPRAREGRWGAGLVGVAWLVERQRKARARGEGCVHGARAVTGSGWPGCFCLSWG